MNIRKKILIFLFSSFVGIFANPELPFASDSIAVTGLSNDRITETVILDEPDTCASVDEQSNNEINEQNSQSSEEVYHEPEYEEPSHDEVAYEEPVYEEPVYEEPVYEIPSNNISIYDRSVELAYTGSTGENAGSATLAWYYKSGKFIYGHNSWNVFGFLNSAYDGGWLNGMGFSVTMDGATSYYTVVNYRLYDYDASDPTHLWYKGSSYKMNPIVRASLDGVSYRMAIMTCYAGSSQRLVIFAN